jgi:hypothetical protein
MSQETEFLPWRILINRLGYLIEQLDTTKVYGNFQNYMIDLIQPLYDNLGWEDKQGDSWLRRYHLYLKNFDLLKKKNYNSIST